MQRAQAIVAIGGDVRNTVQVEVTAPEAVVIEAIHGPGSVGSLVQIEDSSVTFAEDARRIQAEYATAINADTREPIARAALAAIATTAPETFEDVGFRPDHFRNGKLPASKRAAKSDKPDA